MMEAVLSQRTFCVTNVFWGRAFREGFLRHCLPSLLWPQNLAALKRTARNVLLLVTTEEDWNAIADHPAMAAARAHYEVRHLSLGEGEDKFARCGEGYRAAADWTASQDALALHLSPDLLISDGTLGALHDLQEEGAAVVVIPAWRTAEEPFEAALTADEAAGREPMSGARLAALCADAVHDFERDRYWDGATYRDDVGALWWHVPGARGWLMHITSGVPYVDHRRISGHDPSALGKLPFDAYHGMFKPSGGAVRMAGDSDRIFVASFTPSREALGSPRHTRWQYRLPLLGPLARGLALRSQVRTVLARGRHEVGMRGLIQPFRMHPDPLTPAWAETERQAARVIARYVGDMLPPDIRPATAPTRLGGLMLDVLTLLLLPSLALARLGRRMSNAAAVLRDAVRGDAAARGMIRRRLRGA